MKAFKIFSVGGTIDKVYFDAKGGYQVGAPKVPAILERSQVALSYTVESLMRKDSLEMEEQDRALIREKVATDPCRHILITHGTDTMVDTAKALKGAEGKVLVLVGAMEPGRFKTSDADFNIGFAVAALQLLSDGVYIAMSGQVFKPDRVVKNVEQNRFETVS